MLPAPWLFPLVWPSAPLPWRRKSEGGMTQHFCLDTTVKAQTHRVLHPPIPERAGNLLTLPPPIRFNATEARPTLASSPRSTRGERNSFRAQGPDQPGCPRGIKATSATCHREGLRDVRCTMGQPSSGRQRPRRISEKKTNEGETERVAESCTRDKRCSPQRLLRINRRDQCRSPISTHANTLSSARTV